MHLESDKRRKLFGKKNNAYFQFGVVKTGNIHIQLHVWQVITTVYPFKLNLKGKIYRIRTA